MRPARSSCKRLEPGVPLLIAIAFNLSSFFYTRLNNRSRLRQVQIDMQKFLSNVLLALALFMALPWLPNGAAHASEGRLVYLVSDLRIPFWDIMWRGIRQRAQALNYSIEVHSAENDAKRELEHTVAAIKSGVDGIVLSPTQAIGNKKPVRALTHCGWVGINTRV